MDKKNEVLLFFISLLIFPEDVIFATRIFRNFENRSRKIYL